MSDDRLEYPTSTGDDTSTLEECWAEEGPYAPTELLKLRQQIVQMVWVYAPRSTTLQRAWSIVANVYDAILDGKEVASP